MMIAVLETLLVVAVVYLVIRNFLLWHSRGGTRIDSREVAARGQEDLQRWVRTAHEMIRGKRGRLIQAALIVAIVFTAAGTSFPRSLFIVALGAVGLALFSLLKYQVASTPLVNTPTSPTPPPLPTQLIHNPPAPERPTPSAPPSPQEKKRGTGWQWVALSIVALATGGLLFLIGSPPPRHFMRDHMPQTRAILPEPHMVKRRHAAEDFGKELSREIINTVAEAAEGSVSLPTPAEPAEQASPDGVHEFSPDSTIEIPRSGKVRFTTLAFATKDEADHALVERVANFLALSMAQSQNPVTDGSWVPSLDWTARHFAHDRRIVAVHDEKNSVTHYTGEVVLEVPRERAVEQVWGEYLHDQAVDRSWLFLRGYGGAVLMMGGMAIFLRLGTSRHLKPGKVSYKHHWWKRR